ncbi:NUDIX domain-containing protein [Hyphobacterium sp.]|uniref:NUDIX domain-containing protein n=1 Tax=Hyphobacterium sp. TaxID=2004662 RepID=UPI003BAB84F2
MIKRAGWQVDDPETVFENPWMTVRRWVGSRPDGNPGEYGVMSPKAFAIGVIPVFTDGTIMLVGQPRFALDNYSWEIPEGGSPKSAPPIEGAKRELKEETGLTAKNWNEIMQAEVSNSLTDEEAFGYLAWDLTQGIQELDGTEEIELRREPFLKAVEMAVSGEIRDLFSVAMILKAHYMALNGALDANLSAALLDRKS